MEEKSVLNVLNFVQNYYFANSSDIVLSREKDNITIENKDIVLYRIDEVTFEDDAPRKEALENVLSAVRIPGVNFLYLIVGDKAGVKFYYGLARNLYEKTESKLSVKEIGDNILQASIRGNFRGCKINAVSPEDKTPLLQKISSMTHVSRIEGVAGTIKDNEEFQSVDRLVDIMQGEEFCVLLIAKALQPQLITDLENTLQDAYNDLNPIAKFSLQEGSSEGTSKSRTMTKGESSSSTSGSSQTGGSNESETHGTNSSKGRSETKGTNSSSGSSSSSSGKNDSKSTNESGGRSDSKTTGKSNSATTSSSKTVGDSHSIGDQEGVNKSSSKTLSREYLNKNASEWIKYCDEVILPRLDYGKGKGIFLSAFYVLAKKKTALIKLENTALALYSGKQGNRVPLRTFSINGKENTDSLFNYQLPRGHFAQTATEDEKKARSLLSQVVERKKDFPLCNWMTTNELSMLAGLPQKEIIGMRLREEVEFGLNYDEPLTENRISLGKMVQNGNVVPTTPVYLDKNVLDKHIFIAGVTGSGKTTTCHKILLQSQVPFLVIEPAKTEYRILRHNPQCKDLLVFTLGNDSVAPFRLNPFEFLPHENITSHVDMIKASIEAAFDMEAAIPQLIETILYRCYEDCGWDITTNKNKKYDNPFADDINAFPTFNDMLKKIETVVTEQKFDERLKNDYIGSIRARLQSLVLGSKGLMLDTKRSVDFDDLLDRQVVLELEGIKNGSEKALIMGFVLSAFNEAVRARYLRERKAHPHIILIEESHRLLSRFVPGDSLNKKQAVETFADMLAEIRKYGESLIIVDQIPNKLAPDVLKNTNTKIVHRIFAQDDKEAVGNTMALQQDQKEFLSNLNIGRAIMFSDNFGQALQVQIEQETSTSNAPLADEELTDIAFSYYEKCCKRPIFIKPRIPLTKLDGKLRGDVLDFMRNDYAVKMIDLYMKETNEKKWNKYYASILKKMIDEKVYTLDDIVDWLRVKTFAAGSLNDKNAELLKKWLTAYQSNYEELKKVKVSDLF